MRLSFILVAYICISCSDSGKTSESRKAKSLSSIDTLVDGTNTELEEDSQILNLTLDSIFIKAPSQFTAGLIVSEKIQLINNFEEQKMDPDQVGVAQHYLTQYDKMNGFLSYTGAYEGWNEFCVWNLKNGMKLIASGSAACGPLCEYEIYFVRLDNSGFYELEINNVVPAIGLKDFFDIERMKSDGIDVTKWEEVFNGFDLIFKLPKTGKNIILESQFNNFAEFPPEEIDKYSMGTRLALFWRDGTFAKGSLLN